MEVIWFGKYGSNKILLNKISVPFEQNSFGTEFVREAVKNENRKFSAQPILEPRKFEYLWEKGRCL